MILTPTNKKMAEDCCLRTTGKNMSRLTNMCLTCISLPHHILILYIVLVCVCVSYIPQTLALHNQTFVIDYDNDTFLKDGTPFRYISGSIHYARVPEFYWRDRLEKMYTAGLNAAEVYVFWTFHETEPGVFDFTGQKDLVKFLQLAQEIGLLVILRPGPYNCAEWDFGGFPPWILKDRPNIQLRSMDPDYIRLVDRWYDVLLPKLKPLLYNNGGPIITLQIENEYGFFSTCSQDYLRYLKTKFISILGSDVILFTTDAPNDVDLKCGSLSDLYSTVDFSATVDYVAAFEAQRRWQPHGPLVNSEFYDGWHDLWGIKHQTVDKNVFAARLDKLLAYGANVNIYMMHGGTNFGFNNGANYPPFDPTTTSYDFDAAMSEAGDITDKYMAIRSVIGKYRPLPKKPIPPSTPKYAYGTVHMDLVGSLYDLLPKLCPHAPTTSATPVSMERLEQYAGFMLYRHTIKKSYGVCVLVIPGLRDRAYVLIDQVPIGVLQRGQGMALPLSNVTSGQTLDIFVENQGHIMFGANLDDNSKGILGNVTMGGDILLNWQMYTIKLDNILNLSISHYNNIKRNKPQNIHIDGQILNMPSFYVGYFVLPNTTAQPMDTYLNPSSWGKGVVFINDFNLGRYWPLVGPQVTLFTPKTLLKPYPAKNRILMFELELAPCTAGKITPDCSVTFDDVPILNKTVNAQVDQIKGFDHFGKFWQQKD